LITFVENAIKHGTEGNRIDAWINIELKLQGNILVFEVRNGINKNHEKPKSGGIGLPNVKRRLELYYSNRYDLQISENEKSFSVVLNIMFK